MAMANNPPIREEAASVLPQEGRYVRLPMDQARFVSMLRVLRDTPSCESLCDVVVKGQEEDSVGIPCHRLVLSAHSTYFLNIFTIGLRECQEKEVRLKEVPSEVLKTLIEFCYSSDIIISDENVHALLVAAHFLDFRPVTNVCWEYMEKNLDPSNCLMTFCCPLTAAHRPRLTENAKTMVLKKFPVISQSSEFLNVNKDQLIELLRMDGLCAENEDEVLGAVIRWRKHDTDQRWPHIREILRYVRPRFLSSSFGQQYLCLNLFDNAPEDGSTANEETLFKLEDIVHLLESSTVGDESQRRPRKRYGCNQIIVCAGGEVVGITPLDGVHYFDPVSSTWTKKKSLPYPVFGAGLVNVDDEHLFVCGGYSSGDIHRNFLRRVHRYDLSLDVWSDVAPMHYDRNGHSTIILNDHIYVIGGVQGGTRTVLQAVERYDPAIDRWHSVADLLVPLYWFAAVAHNGGLYTFGGLTANGSVVSTTFCYDPQKNTWSELASMPTPRFWCTACVGPDGLIYVIGGRSTVQYSELNHILSTVEAYDTSTNQWLRKGSLNKRRCYVGIACANNKMYVLGGYREGVDSMEVYDDHSDRWTVHGSHLPQGMYNFGCTVVRVKPPN
ncbi:kelch-like protein 12 [Paramacrobiotus metropolitanus]|uniref:kelch-like protein 12 n=1 Tax=Paramacrobiotus metropolitanus TaxID=2943436 RepID=UPI002446335A|nr:kelch-like protein 12 [Paramacrobiotus metropolitanus]XP_055344168.1 kelch-like protein 12 [Paramacrobiotus metropolitanus]XP_055344169.1 kelch-like protein 12 [Paramacrobiotus metropolitanus]